MPDPPTFSFGAPASSGAAAPSLFGSTSSATPANVFGQSTGNAPSTSGSAFGSNNAQGGEKPSLFGGNSKPSGGFSFGGASAGGTGNLFGGAGASSTPSGGTGFSFGQKSAENAPSQPNTSSSQSAPTPNIFGSAKPDQPTSTGSMFQGFGSNAASPNPSGATTPSGNKPSPLSFSTTPAGPPPQLGATSNLFGGAAKAAEAPKQNLFGGGSTGQDAGQQKLGGLFGTKPAEQSATPTGSEPTPQSVFGQPPSGGPSSGGLFGNLSKQSTQPSQTPQKPLFGAPDTSKSNESTTPKPSFQLGAPSGTSTQQSTSQPQTAAAPSLFSKPAEPASGPNATGAAPLSFGNFGKKDAAAAASAQPASSTPATSTLFGGAAATQPASSGTQSSGTAAPSMFSLGKRTEEQASSGQPAANSSATNASAAPSLFGKPAAGAKSLQPTPSATAPTNGANPTHGTNGPNTTFGASTTGPAPPAASRLASKSLDEILTLWTTSLTSHQKTFGNLATKVSAWDRSLVQNSDKISDLYRRTFQAERDTAEVERQLSLVENEQQELEHYLDQYEKTVDELIARHGGVEGGVDAERERTYRTAEKCSSRLTDMSQDLTSMIEEINLASTNLRQSNKSANTQDPLSQIVRVLNGHLAQLQQIDSGASTLQQKVSAAQKEVRTLGRNGGLGGDEVDSFARSYLGRR